MTLVRPSAQGVQAQSAVEFIGCERLVQLLIFGAMACVALIVAALGIADTMLMSVLERREIVIIKPSTPTTATSCSRS